MRHVKVFVPMFGDSFFTIMTREERKQEQAVFVPMFGDSFSLCT